MPKTLPASGAWTRLSVVLHWAIVLFLICQWLDGDQMRHIWGATTEGKPMTPNAQLFGWAHIIVGTTILVAAALRLLDRLTRGRPPYPQGEPTWATLLAKFTHAAIYIVLLAMPALGLAAWLTGIDRLAHLHTFLWTPLLVLVALHVLGALVQQFHFKSDVLGRMTRLRQRTSAPE